jgi:hypothetical protein
LAFNTGRPLSNLAADLDGKVAIMKNPSEVKHARPN